MEGKARDTGVIPPGFRIFFFSFSFFSFSSMLLSLCYLKFKHYDEKIFFLHSIPVQNHGIFCFFTYFRPCLSFRVLGFIFEGRRGSKFLFTFSFAFSGFLKCPPFVELEKQKQKQKNMSPQSIASSILVILSLN